MNINTVIEYLNKTYGYDLSSDYYIHIADWKDWWKGRHKPFHTYIEKDFNGKSHERDLYTLKMGKKVTEDWASMLLNEKVLITVDDPASNALINGHEDDQDGVLFENNFAVRGNELVEKSFATGTGAFVLRLDDMTLKDDVVQKSADTKIHIEYLTADCIVPLTVKYREVVDVAFVSEVLQDGKKYVYIETHILENGSYTITNAYFKEEEGQLKEESLPEGILPSFKTGSDIPLFSLVKPNICNNIDEATALGVSIFANAIDNLKGVDLAYNNFNRDFKLGGKKVFVNEDITKRDEYGNEITPDDVAQQLFTVVTDGIPKENDRTLIHEHNPELRVQENIDGIQAQLDFLSFKCGLGTKYYRFNTSGTLVTATQYVGDRQDLQRNIAKQHLMLDAALKKLIRAILYVGREVLGEAVNPDAKITIDFDDSFISDKESERTNAMQEVRDGLLQKYEYRMRYFGEDEATAKAMVIEDAIATEENWFSGAITTDPPEVQGKSLNGAQTQSLIAIMAQYSAGDITEGQAINLINTAIGVTKEEAGKILRGEL